MLLLLWFLVGCLLSVNGCDVDCQANEEGEESQSKKAVEEMKQQIAQLQKGLYEPNIYELISQLCSQCFDPVRRSIV